MWFLEYGYASCLSSVNAIAVHHDHVTMCLFVVMMAHRAGKQQQQQQNQHGGEP